MSDQRHVALLIDTATSWGSGLIEGVAMYAKDQQKDWVFSFEPRGKYDRMMLPEGWKGDGVVTRITHPALAEQLIASHLPAVNVSWFRYGENLIPRCTCDELAAAKMAADYFIDNGFRQFAYCGSTLRPSYYDRLGEAFVKTLSEAGYACNCFSVNHDQFSLLDSRQQINELSDWLKQLAKPVALLTFDNIQGRQVTEACMLSKLAIPEDIAVLGGEYDELCSKISSPPLSGIDHGPKEVGLQAAQMLDQLMSGDNLKKTNLRLPPLRVISRQSTDKIAIPDELLVEAIQYIRLHYSEALRIRDILHAIPLSRRAMEIGFRDYLGRTPREEIRRIRVEKAIEMLCDTDWSVTKIASDCGFDRPELLTRAFRKELKITPTKFRKRHALHNVT